MDKPGTLDGALDALEKRIEEWQRENAMLAASLAFRMTANTEAESALVFLPDAENRFAVTRAIRLIEQYDMKIVGFVLEQTTPYQQFGIVYRDGVRLIGHQSMRNLMQPDEESDE